MNDAMATPVEEKRKDKITGCRIRILDDGSFIVNVDNTDYTKSKEYSYNSFDDMASEIKEYLQPKKNGYKDHLS